MKFILLFTICLLVLFFVVFLSRETIYQALGDFLVVQDDLKPADVIHVIAGEDYRTEHAIDLYKHGYGKVIFFTGGWCDGHQYYHGQHSLQLALDLGVPLEAIAFDDSPVTSTYSETLLLKDWLDQHSTPNPSVIVVSDPFHMRRARWTASRLLGKNAEVQMAPVPFNKTPFIHDWWKNNESRNYVKNEYEKFFYYILRYQISRGIIKDWLIALDTE